MKGRKILVLSIGGLELQNRSQIGTIFCHQRSVEMITGHIALEIFLRNDIDCIGVPCQNKFYRNQVPRPAIQKLLLFKMIFSM